MSSQLSSAFSGSAPAKPERQFSLQVIIDTEETVGKFRQKDKTAQSRAGDGTNFSRDVTKINGMERLLWAGGKPLVGGSDGHDDLAYPHHAQPRPGFCDQRDACILP